MLTALVHERHDNGDTVCLACHGSDNTLHIGIVIVWGHHICLTTDLVLDAMVYNINHDVNISTTYGIL